MTSSDRGHTWLSPVSEQDANSGITLKMQMKNNGAGLEHKGNIKPAAEAITAVYCK